MRELGKLFPKKSDKNKKKTQKINVKMPHVNKKKPLARKRHLVQTKTAWNEL